MTRGYLAFNSVFYSIYSNLKSFTKGHTKMFGFLRRLFTKKPTYKKYDEYAVRYVLSSILSSTIDRRVISLILEEELKYIVGKDIINNIYKKINHNDKRVDKWNINKWMTVLDNKQLEE